MKKIIFMNFMFLNFATCVDISGIYKTHKGTQGGQSIVEIFKDREIYYVYGLKNLENDPIKDDCNKNKKLRNRLSVGNVFAYKRK